MSASNYNYNYYNLPFSHIMIIVTILDEDMLRWKYIWNVKYMWNVYMEWKYIWNVYVECEVYMECEHSGIF